MISHSFCFLALVAFSRVSAHGYVKLIKTGGKEYLPYRPYESGGNTNTITRVFSSNSPTTDLTSDNLACNFNDNEASVNNPAPLHADVKAGDPIELYWTEIDPEHRGPMMTWLSKCDNDDCTTYVPKGDAWFKIDEIGFLGYEGDNSMGGLRFGTDTVAESGYYTSMIPPELKAGAYIMRHEWLGLQNALEAKREPQFYVQCHQLMVASDGTSEPSASDLVSIPGVFKADDPGILLDIWSDKITSYTVPGPAPWKPSGSTPVLAGEESANSTSKAPTAQPTKASPDLSEDAPVDEEEDATIETPDEDESSESEPVKAPAPVEDDEEETSDSQDEEEGTTDEEEPVSEDEDTEQIPDAVPTTSRTRPADRETASASRSRYASRTSGPRRMHWKWRQAHDE